MISGQKALNHLREGNLRFASERSTTRVTQAQRTELIDGQSPSAVIIGCSDSRVPVEMIFDQGLGELFVIRVAGNIITPSQMGSVEFAIQHYGTQLVVVLGHSNCGAVGATLEALRTPEEKLSSNLCSIVEHIRPVFKPLLESDPSQDSKTLIQKAVRANVQTSAHCLRNDSPTLQKRIAANKLLVVGAEYSLSTGLVDFFDGVPEMK